MIKLSQANKEIFLSYLGPKTTNVCKTYLIFTIEPIKLQAARRTGSDAAWHPHAPEGRES